MSSYSLSTWCNIDPDMEKCMSLIVNRITANTRWPDETALKKKISRQTRFDHATRSATSRHVTSRNWTATRETDRQTDTYNVTSDPAWAVGFEQCRTRQLTRPRRTLDDCSRNCLLQVEQARAVRWCRSHSSLVSPPRPTFQTSVRELVSRTGARSARFPDPLYIVYIAVLTWKLTCVLPVAATSSEMIWRKSFGWPELHRLTPG